MVTEKLPRYDKVVLVYLTIGGRMCGKLISVKRSISDDAPFDDRWFAVPGWGHELRSVEAWCELPPFPIKTIGD